MNEVIYVKFIICVMTITPSPFEYYTPSTMDEAINLLDKYGDEAKLLAGGQSLIPLMKMRFASISHVVDISRIEEMDYIREEEGRIRVGALTTVAELGNSPAISRTFPIIREAVELIADPLVRNMGTVGGNISHGDPANDLPSIMLALGATFMVLGKEGSRELSADHFFVDSLMTALEPNEILYEIRIPKPTGKQGGSYVKHKKSAGDFSVAAVATNVVVDTGGSVKSVGVGLTAVAPTAIKSKRAESILVGKKLDEKLAAEAAKIISEESDPVSDFYGSVEYKKKVLRHIIKESLLIAYERAKEVQ